MSAPHSVPSDGLPTALSGSKAPVWWGMLVLVAIETTVFATLISSYFFLRFNSPDWPPGEIQEPDLMLPIVNTIVLATSTIFIYFAGRGLKQGRIRRLKWLLGIGLLLEVVFFIIKLFMSTGGQFDWSTHAYGSIFFTINWLHTGHVAVAIVMGTVAEILAFRGYFTAERQLGIQVVNIYFQFVALIWIPVFVVLFLAPRWY